MAEKRMKDKSIAEIEEEFLSYGKIKDWRSLDASASYLAVRYLANERYEDALEAIVSSMAIQLSGCCENDRVCNYDEVNVCTYRIGMIKECGEKLSLSQEKLEKKVKDLLGSAFGILPFSYYEPETALAILKDCRSKPFDPRKYRHDHGRPKAAKAMDSKSNDNSTGSMRLEPCPCF
ncbi:MAG: hypothetical protein ACRC8T_05405 [Acidaminococcaceae bacterium]